MIQVSAEDAGGAVEMDEYAVPLLEPTFTINFVTENDQNGVQYPRRLELTRDDGLGWSLKKKGGGRFGMAIRRICLDDAR